MFGQTHDRATVLQERLDRQITTAREAVAENFGEGELPVVERPEPAAACCPLFGPSDAPWRGSRWVSRSCPSS